MTMLRAVRQGKFLFKGCWVFILGIDDYLGTMQLQSGKFQLSISVASTSMDDVDEVVFGKFASVQQFQKGCNIFCHYEVSLLHVGSAEGNEWNLCGCVERTVDGVHEVNAVAEG